MVFYLGYSGTQYRVRLHPPFGHSILYRDYNLTRFNHQKNRYSSVSMTTPLGACRILPCRVSFAVSFKVRAAGLSLARSFLPGIPLQLLGGVVEELSLLRPLV